MQTAKGVEMVQVVSNRMPRVAVEYDYYAHRNIREFDDAHEAHRFYAAKSKAGRNPAVKSVQSGDVKKGA